MKNKKLVTAIASLLAFILLGYFGMSSAKKSDDINKNLQTDGTIVVNYIDVGQGDSEFIQLPDGKCMLIDAGEAYAGSIVAEKIAGLGYTKIDYLVATHPHADHIGGMKEIVQKFDIGEIYMPKAKANTKTFQNLLLAISDKGLSIHTAKAGTVIFSSDDLLIELLAPVSSSYDNLNNWSAVVRIEYGSNSFMFMGDAEELPENEILETYPKNKLKTDVLKVGHHGSSTASSQQFVSAVLPRYAIIEVGKDNSYNHPHYEAVNNLSSSGAEIFRTDIKGNIAVVSDKNHLTVVCEKD